MIRTAGIKDWPYISYISSVAGYDDYINKAGIDYLNTGTVLVYYDDKIKGFMKIEEMPDNTIWLSGIRVDPDYRNLGIASSLIDYARKYNKKMRLIVEDSNYKSINMVKKNKFKEIKRFLFINGIPDVSGDEYFIDDDTFLNYNWKFVFSGDLKYREKYIKYRDSRIFKHENAYQILELNDDIDFIDGGYTAMNDIHNNIKIDSRFILFEG
ncbi:GNAT family N-acetyltransferase [Picrophilus oshimae]|uniref:Acetyltransferase n=1 Tax=Picrophilus torridus (strain ATCC 700027 / DSM 9790 / JCM 10055 / NBRC 100828 / KAW 2/3) TaxID=1122961 RepID=Q6L283_PICTO|nr:GNAT family N-acetyltransferase [Picrophilus oshimae]AAT42919.1 acetyltransferase [Picrophilus oshimae DSM 9789]